MFIERHLNELLCRSIRYHLRLLFNPPPPRLTPLDKNYEQRSKAFSTVHDMIEMVVLDDKKKEWLLGGDKVTSLVNEALSFICSLFGVRNLLDPAYEIPTVSSEFCTSDPAQRQLPNNNNQKRLDPLTPDELNQVLDDMDHAFQVLITAKATKFLMGLLSIPKVISEIRRLGGWGDVETYATLLWRYELWEHQPAYEHFVLLSNYKTLSTRLVSIQTAIEAAGDAAENSLKELGKRYRVNAKKQKKQLLNWYPEIRSIDETLQDGWTTVRMFPTVEEK